MLRVDTYIDVYYNDTPNEAHGYILKIYRLSFKIYEGKQKATHLSLWSSSYMREVFVDKCVIRFRRAWAI